MQACKIMGFLVVLAIFSGCSDESESLPTLSTEALMLPKVGSTDSCIDEDTLTWSGGDLFRESDRIAFGTVTSVEVLGLSVTMNVSSNLKGSGESLAFRIGAGTIKTWPSWPIARIDGRWLPTEVDIQTQVREDFGWTGDSGVQVGQELVVFLREDGGIFAPLKLPMAQLTDQGLEFQSDRIQGACIRLNSEVIESDGIAALNTALQAPELAANAASPLANRRTAVKTDCTPRSISNSRPMPEEPDPAL